MGNYSPAGFSNQNLANKSFKNYVKISVKICLKNLPKKSGKKSGKKSLKNPIRVYQAKIQKSGFEKSLYLNLAKQDLRDQNYLYYSQIFAARVRSLYLNSKFKVSDTSFHTKPDFEIPWSFCVTQWRHLFSVILSVIFTK